MKLSPAAAALAALIAATTAGLAQVQISEPGIVARTDNGPGITLE